MRSELYGIIKVVVRLALSMWTMDMVTVRMVDFFFSVGYCLLPPSQVIWLVGRRFPEQTLDLTTRIYRVGVVPRYLRTNVECATVWDRNGDNSIDCAGNRNGDISPKKG